MILICGGLADSVTELVCARLNDCGYPYRLLDLGKYPDGFDINWHWQNSSPSGYISCPDWKLNLEEINSVYIRYVGTEGRTPRTDVAPEAMGLMYFEYDSGIMALIEDLPCTVVNRLRGSMSNNSKLYQALLIRECGLLTPSTLVTNDAEEARQFYEECNGEVIYKSLSGIRSIVNRLKPEQLSRLSLLKNGPAQFQELIPGENVRVHTVGDKLFPTRVHSASVDYRYARHDGNKVEMESTTLPTDIAEACLQIADQLNLSLTGIDLKEAPDGKYYCFEVNPCPGFLYYERNSGQPISKALADLLYNSSNTS
jgi:glutathione synthase/RimK-type ligase-like ATP-grasp enzyme